MKPFTIFLALFSGLLSAGAFAQAGSSGTFTLRVTFERKIPVNDLEVFYIVKNGNHIDSMAMKADTARNELLIYGHNDYIIGVSFPTLVFSLRSKEKPGSIFNFYLFSTGSLFSYTGEQTKKILFTYKEPNVVAGLALQDEGNSHKKLTTMPMANPESWAHNLEVGNEMTRIVKR